jgi:primosomal protein N' (replication factor Y)
MERKTLFVDVIVPLSLPRLFTYRVPQILEPFIKSLQRVIVPFGKKKRYTAIVHHVHETPPREYEARYLEQILDEEPSISIKQLEFWEWMSDYYLCHLGEVMQAALPAGLKLSSETVIRALDSLENIDSSQVSDREYLILEALDKVKELSIKDIEHIAGIKTVYPIIREMMKKRLIAAEEELRNVFRQRTETWVHLHSDYQHEEALHQLLNQLKRAPKQQEFILAFLSMNPGINQNFPPVKKKELLQKTDSTGSSLMQLLKKGVFVLEDVPVSRLTGESQTDANFQLSEAQNCALSSIHESFAEGRPALLHGFTGSGKTELYIRLIEEQIERGKQVLYMLPEIALTAQIINRLRIHFGRKVQVYHSRFSENERVEVWNAVLTADEESGMIVLGARSSVFLPFKDLGLVIVDEEHETSFKQNEPAPRYHGRDAAIMLASQFKADICLGSATPSIESYYNAQSGKYKLVKLQERFGGSVLPEIIINDLRADTKRRRMKGVFSPALIEEMEESLKKKRQIILFQNRRGFAPMIECHSCNHVPHCVQCDISLTYHKAIHQLRCHYCGYSMNVPSQCAQCSSTDLRMKGFGTEKIEEELSEILPDITSARMDLDTTRSKYAYHKLIEDFEQQRIQVLIGTQMVTKGLDFDLVDLVAVLSADSMLNYPDFRAFERSFQLFSQVAGRAGRREIQGRVIIQTWKPDHPVLIHVQNHDYETFYSEEIEERKRFFYPPFSRIIHITLKHETTDLLDQGAEQLANFLRQTFQSRILGPEYPAVARVRNLFQKRILMKIEPQVSLKKVKAELQKQIEFFFKEYPLKNFRLVIDVDPLN